MDLSDAMSAQGLSLISATPVEIQKRLWACVGFEEYGESLGDHPHLAMIYCDIDWAAQPNLYVAVRDALRGRKGVLTRIHSECILGDAFGSSMCDCGDQLRLSMEEMETRREGLLIYLRQEGRGIGLRNKLDCLALQYGYKDGGKGHRRYSSDEANIAMGFDVDHRNYNVAAGLVKSLGIVSTQIVTGNPKKIADLEACGIKVDGAMDIWTNGHSPRALEEIEEKISRGYIYQR